MTKRSAAALFILASVCALALGAAPALAAASGTEPAGGAAIGEVIGATLGASIATALVLALALGHRAGRLAALGRAAAFTERVSGLPGWAALPSAVASVSLLTALFGMYWDISLHIGQGRDEGPLANPSHYFILVGLFGVFAAGVLAIFLPRERPGAAAVRLGRDWYAPLGGLIMLACSSFSLVGFPLDDMWHRLFGQDVTLWGPTHLMLIGGAGMALIGHAVLLVEGYRARGTNRPPGRPTWERGLRVVGISGGFLIGLSTFQGEFDFGVPQFQLIFHPVLIMAAAGIALVTARVWGGPGAALGAAAFFVAIRGGLAVIVGPVLGEPTPHLPLYLVEAAVVELVALGIPRSRPLAFGAAAGAGIGTIGLAAEWGWSQLWMPIAWPSSLLPEAAVLGLAAAVAGGLLGGWIGEALSLRPRFDRPSPARRALVPAAAATIAALVALGLATSPRDGVSVAAQLEPSRTASGERAVTGTLRLDPPSAARDARWINVTAWQGDGLVVDPLRRIGEGVYRTTEPIPVGGNWKTMVRLHTGRSLTGMPIRLPEDPAIPAAAVPWRPSLERAFTDEKGILQREARTNDAWVTALAYGTVLGIALTLLGALGWGLTRLGRGESGEPPAPPRPPRARTRSMPGTERVPA